MTELHPLTPDAAREVSAWVTTHAEAVLMGGPLLPWPLTVKALLAIAADPLWRVYVLQDAAGKVVASGSLYSKEDGHRLRIGRVIVDPSRRGEGWGRVLMEALLELADTDPAVTVTELGVFDHNVVALGLYRRLGFTRVRETRPVDVDGETWNVLELERPAPQRG